MLSHQPTVSAYSAYEADERRSEPSEASSAPKRSFLFFYFLHVARTARLRPLQVPVASWSSATSRLRAVEHFYRVYRRVIQITNAILCNLNIMWAFSCG